MVKTPMSRTRHPFLRVIVAMLAFGAICYGLLWACAEYEVHRASSMVAELSRVRIGDTEASVLALTSRYGGFKWTPDPLPPREQWVDKEEYDYEVTRQSEYKYALGVGPLPSFGNSGGRLAKTLWTAREVIPEHLRPFLGLRDWSVESELSIRNGRVYVVSMRTLFEGRSEWLGHEWEVADAMPRYGMPARSYAVGAAYLTIPPGGGEAITNFYTSRASDEEVEAAHNFNSKCLTSVQGCRGLCDAAPRPLAYLKQHPDAAWNIIPPQCN